MIPAITEHFGNEAQWATLHQATVTLSDMGDRTISTQVRIDGDHVPNFSNWWLEFKGEKFILPIRDPQALKDNSSRNSIIDLTFYSWATYQMKRFFFMSLSQISANVAIPNKYNASIVMPVENFVELFNKVLRQYFGNKIRMDLYNMGQGYYSNEPVAVEINNTYIWDVLIKFYELFNLRWRIVYEQATDTYAIKVNYPAEVLDDHDFEYGYEGGLLRFERQVQDDDIRNILLGRGGERNLPYRYFKLEDEAAGSVWAGDPDAIPELSNIYFERLRDINFRWYVRGWMHNPNRDTSGDEAWDPGHVFPTYEISDTDPHYWAYQKGLTDLNFDPVEYEKDDESIAKFGERWGALDDNDDIYPTIQGVEVTGLGRIDEICGVSDIITDDIDAAAKSAATEVTIGGAVSKTVTVPQHGTASCDWTGDTFTVPAGTTGILTCQPTFSAKPRIWHPGDPPQETYKAYIRIEAWSIEARDENGNSIISTNGTLAPIPAGTYRLYVTSLLANDGAVALETTFTLSSPVLTTTLVDADSWKPTFDIWVKNIWQTEQGSGETDAQYATRVWEKILGDRAGNEAKVVFSDGFMSLSEDYNFVIASYPVVDRSKTLPSGVRSEWKITLYKSDAEYDATGKFIPNADASAKPVAGDHFFFTGIDMPHQYVIWAEERINQNKVENLDEVKDINPSWVIGLDKVRVHTQEAADQAGLLADRLAAGTMITIKDRRFTNNQQLSLYIQTLTYTWQEPTQDSPYLVPDIEVVLSDKVVAVGSPVEKLNNDVSVIRSTYAKVTDIEDVVRRVATPLFLKKTGESDLSESPTSFGSAVRSKSFRQGAVGGEGWGHYLDGEGHSVLELDKLVVRQELQVNSLVANQISSVGGREILSAASMQCIQVVETDDSYICYFDQRRGTVANLFRVGDFAMGQQFDPDNSEQRYYRARVTAVDSDSITLSKAVKDGAGVPVVGDTIVQYGSDTDSSRQYVIVRDVIGGGYERMISGLTTVNAAGTEYYFAGRQNGSTPRWFVGDSNGEYAEWQNGILNIKGRISVRKSDGSYQAMDSYIAGINSSLVNLQDQIDGAVQTWAGNVAPTLNNYPASAWTDTPTRNNHLGDLYYDTETGHGYRFMYTEDDGFFWFQLTDEDVTLALAEAARANAGVAGLQYLKTALADGTTIVEGGLVLTNLIQLGKTENGVFNVYSGINGLVDTTARGNGIAAWYGGPMADKEATPTPASYAKSLFRFDGSGYLASGNIGWDASGAGHIPGISWQGNSVIISGDVKLASLSGDSVTELLTLVRNLNNWFGEDASGDIFVKRKADGITPRNFYSHGGVSAYGVNGSGGGGGGVDLERVWQSLTNNTDFPDVEINAAHIPYGLGFTERTDTTSGVKYFDANVRSVVKGTEVAGGDVTTANGVVTIQFPTAVTGIEYARDLLDADDLCFVDPEEGEEIEIDDPGVTGTVLWGSESNSQVLLDVNGTSKWLLKPDAISGIESSVGIILGYFVSGSARNAIKLNGHEDTYFATASSLSDLADTVDGLVTGVSSVAGKSGDVTLAITDITGLQAALASKLEVAVTSLGTKTGAITLGAGLAISNDNVLSVTGQTMGTVTRVDLGSTQYAPDANGVVGLPAYPTTLPASDVYAWAKKASLDVADVPGLPWSKITSGTPTTLSGYGITDVSFSSAGVADKIRITLGNNYYDVLTAHQSLEDYATKTYVGQQGFITKAVSDLTNYYLKSETYTQSEVNALIAAINQFHYEIAPTTSAVTDPKSNVLYLIGPIGSGTDKYEEYVYPNATTGWVKIGDTSIDLSGYLLSSVAAQTYQPLDADLTAIAALAGGGLLKRNADNSWTLDTSTYITGITSQMIRSALGYTPMDIDDAFIEDGDIHINGQTITPLVAADLAGYVNDLQSSGSGNYVSAISKSGKILTATYGTLPTVITAARDLDDADDLCFVDPEEGVDVEIDDPGTTGTVLWGSESASQVSLDVNGVSKTLLKAAALDGINSSIGVLLGYFSSGAARNALALGGHGADYFATVSGLSELETEVSGLVTGVSSVVGQEGDVTVTQIATALISAGYKLTDTIYTLPIAGASTLGGIKIGTGLSIDGSGVVSVTGQTQGTVTRVDVGSTQYSPDVNGVVGLPAYPTTLPASDVYSWAKAENKPNYTFSEIGSTPTTLAGYGITDVKFGPAGVSDKIRITLGSSNYHDVLTAHQSLSNYYDKTETDAHISTAIEDLGLGNAATYGIGSVTSGDNGLVTGGDVWSAIDALPEPMIFKGSLGTGGTITVLPTASSANEGWTYKVIEAGTYASQAAKIGDLFISNGSAWIWIPSGDEPTGTVTSVGLSVPTGLSVSNSPVTSSGTLAVTFASGYSIPLTADTNKGVTAYGWGDHSQEGYLKSVAFADLTSHPNSIAGYGIDDAYIEDHDIHLGNGSITVLAADTVYDLVVKNSAGTTVLTYNPANISGGELTLTKAMVGLGNVENTALSSWAGTQNINTLGTITTGVWNGTAIAADKLAIGLDWSLVMSCGTYDTEDYIHLN